MTRVSYDYLHQATAEDIIEKLKFDKMSVLLSLNSAKASKMRREMSIVGLVCRLVLWLIHFKPEHYNKLTAWLVQTIFLPTKISDTKSRTLRIVETFFPTNTSQNAYHYVRSEKEQTAIVAYFNHQSLFEVLACICWCIRTFEGKRFIFPVNLPWYEQLIPVSSKLARLGIDIVPLITPNTHRKLIWDKPLRVNESVRNETIRNIINIYYEVAYNIRQRLTTKKRQNRDKVINQLKATFEKHYFAQAATYALSANVIAVAPSATRTRTIFPDKETFEHGNDRNLGMPKTISAIIIAIARASRRHIQEPLVDFVPFVATREGRIGKRLNLFRKHEIYIGEAMDYNQALDLHSQRMINYVAYHNLAEFVPEHIKYPS